MQILRNMLRGATSGFSKALTLDRGRTLRMAECLTAVTVLASVSEYVTNGGDRRRGGLNDWQVVRETQRQMLPAGAFRLFDVVSNRVVSFTLTLSKGVIAIVVLSGRANPRISGALQIGSALAQLLLGPRTRRGSDGSDNATMQAAIAIGAARIFGTPRATDVALSHLALQATLAYQAAGWTKLPNPDWRSGEALLGVMRTRAYGDGRSWQILHSHPRVARVLSCSVLGFECAFMLVFARCAPLTWLLTAIAACFHVTVGITMGLGRFTTAFPAMLVAVPYVFGSRRVGAADQVLPRLFAGTIGIGCTLGAISSARREHRYRRAKALLRSHQTKEGTTVRFEEYCSDLASDLCFVLLPGLGSSEQDLVRWATRLSSAARVIVLADVLGGQTLTAGGLDTALLGISEFASTLPERVVLVGHSLGACLAGSIADLVPESVFSVIRVDPTNPATVDTNASTNAILRSLYLFPSTLFLSGGWSLRRPERGAGLPEPARRRSSDLQRTPSWWRRTAHLFRVVLDGWATNGVPGVVSSQGVDIFSPGVFRQRTSDALADPRRPHHVIDGSSHHSLLSAPEHARAVTDIILEHVKYLEHAQDRG
ncbi:alpha/beta fold hydrolase [Curtobacterium sp. VKM Ac-2852]|uniref:alpha/beta fold hydrolase n=1 Tax=Curtobacterium sp. VKM Ac-2852 TaxID=2739024 RepID=UPI00349F496C